MKKLIFTTIALAMIGLPAVAQTGGEDVISSPIADTMAATQNIAPESRLPEHTDRPNELQAEFYYMTPAGTKVDFDNREVIVEESQTAPGQQVVSIGSFSKHRGEEAIIVYPNPAVNYTQIILPDIAYRPIHCYITDMQGGVISHLVYSPGGNQIGIDLTGLEDGRYVVRVQEEGNKLYFARLIKQ